MISSIRYFDLKHDVDFYSKLKIIVSKYPESTMHKNFYHYKINRDETIYFDLINEPYVLIAKLKNPVIENVLLNLPKELRELFCFNLDLIRYHI